MSYYQINLQAGVPYRQDTPGVLLLLDSTGAASGVDLELINSGTARTKMPNRQAAFRIETGFDGVILTSAVNTTIGIFLSFENVSLGVSDGSAVKVPDGVVVVNSPAQPIPVSFAGTVAPVLGTVNVNNTDAQAIPVQQKVGNSFSVEQKAAHSFSVEQKAGTIFTVEQATEVNTLPYMSLAVTNGVPVSVTDVAAILLAANVNRRGFRVKNVGDTPVALGGAGVVIASAVIVIQPGEIWNENEAPGAAWSCICDAGMASTLNIQTIA